MKPMYEIFYRALGGKVQSKDGLSNVVQRQTGGPAFAPNLFSMQPPGQIPLPYPIPPRPEPKPIIPPSPPPEPEIIYDPVREAAAEKAFRDIQARRISELDEAPQTRAEREALQAKGGFYRDEDGAVRDAMGNVQEDFGFDYVAPPEPGRPDPVNTPDTPPPVVPDDPTDPLPLPPVTPDPLPPLPDVYPIRPLPGPVYPRPYPFPDKPVYDDIGNPGDELISLPYFPTVLRGPRPGDPNINKVPPSNWYGGPMV